MKYLSIAAALVAALTAGACSTQSPAPASGETLLLVSLEDGSVIRQTINSGADLCFKMNSESTTTCFTQGEPVVDQATNTVVGFRMIEDHIDLVAKTE